MREYIWNFYEEGGKRTVEEATAKAKAVALALTAQNKAGRQALGCKPRRFSASGTALFAEPME